jgi:hypothetical protein
LYLDAQYPGLASRRIVGNQVRRRVRLADQYRSNASSFRLMCSPTCCPIRGQKRKLSPRETMSARGDIPVHLIYVSYSIESGLVSMIGMAHFPTVGSIAWLTRFSIFLFPSLGPLCTLLSNSWARAFCAFGTASINSASASLKLEAA